MRLRQIEATGVKGALINILLTPITLVCGENAAGKSAILTAVRILLTGKNPLASRQPMEIVGTTDTGDKLVRRWKPTKAGLKADHLLPDGWPETPVVLLDPLDYLDRSERERVKYISSLVSSAESGGEWVVNKVRGLQFESPTREVILAHELEINTLEYERPQRTSSISVQEWLEMLVKYYATRWTTAKDAVERLKGYGAAQVQLQSSEQALPTRNVDVELTAATKRYGEASARLAALLRAEKESVSSAEYQSRLQGEATRLTDKSGEIARLEQELEVEQAKINAYRSRVPDIASQLNALTVDRNKLTYEHELQTRVVQRAEDEIRSILARLCPCCANSGEACQANRRAVDRERVKIVEAQKVLDANAGNLAAVDASISRLSDAQTVAFGEDDVIRQSKQLVAAKWTALSQLRTQQAAFLKVNEQLKAVGIATPPSQVEIQEARVAVEAETKTLNDLQTMQKRHAAAQQEESRRLQSLKELTEAEATFTVVKEVRQAINDAQGELIGRLFGGLLETINRVAKDLIETPVEYHEGEIGRRSQAGEWISHRDFSGFEKAVTYAGIAAALAKAAPVKVVLIDDLIISRQNKHRLVTRFIELIEAGVVDQLLLTDCDSDDFAELVHHRSDVFSVVNV